MRHRHLTAFVTTLLLALIGAFSAAPALAADPIEHGGKPGDNLALAINETDGATVVDVAFAITRTMAGVVDNQNVAVAYSSCTKCTTVAVAFQILLVMGSPQTVAPMNVAVATNAGCSFCNTLATAYQFVFGVEPGFRFSKRGLREIYRIKRLVTALAYSGRPIAEIQAGIDALAKRLQAVLEREILLDRERRKNGGDGQNGDQGPNDSEPPPDEPPSGTTEPTDPTGPTGPTEPTEPTGPTGPTGPTEPAPTGPTGPTSP
jgi:putative peptide zinc metalloprotease protein